MADKGLQSATIRLQPDHLGPVEIRLRVDADGASQVQFSAQHAHARDALEAAIPRLRELFADHGLDLRQANVDAGRGGFAHAGPGHERDRGGAREAEPAALETSIHWPARRPERRLDVLV
jgi:flagellar hook-length control protein FliK